MAEHSTYAEYKKAADLKYDEVKDKYNLTGKALEKFTTYANHINSIKELAYSGNLYDQHMAQIQMNGSYAEPGFERRFYSELNALGRQGTEGLAIARTVKQATDEWRGALAPDTLIEQTLYTPYRDEKEGWKLRGLFGALGGFGIGAAFSAALSRDLQISNWVKAAITAVMTIAGGMVGNAFFGRKKDEEEYIPQVTPAVHTTGAEAESPQLSPETPQLPPQVRAEALAAGEDARNQMTQEGSEAAPRQIAPNLALTPGASTFPWPEDGKFPPGAFKMNYTPPYPGTMDQFGGGRPNDGDPINVTFMQGGRPIDLGRYTYLNANGFQEYIGLNLDNSINATFGQAQGYGGYGYGQGYGGYGAPVALPVIPGNSYRRTEGPYSPTQQQRFPPGSATAPDLRGVQGLEMDEANVELAQLPNMPRNKHLNGRG